MTKTRKKGLTIALSLCLAIVVAVGGTLAWITYTTDTLTNEFNVVTSGGSDPDLKAELVENKFTADEQLKAKSLAPGGVIKKDPLIKNTSKTDELKEWVGMKVAFVKGDGSALSATDMNVFNRVFEYTSHANWIRKNTGALTQKEVYYFNAIVNKGAQTEPLFPEVKVKTSATNADLETVKDTWKGMKIVITGAAVQHDVSTTLDAAVKAELDALLA